MPDFTPSVVKERRPNAADGQDARRLMRTDQRWLLVGGMLTGVASLLHLAIIAGGPDWYRFFGAGERMARQAALDSPYPAIITAAIAIILGVWTLYALSGAGVIRPLPLLRVALGLIAAVYFLRGVLGIPVILLVDDPYTTQLRAKMTFMVVSSAICIGLGVCYAIGAAGVWKRSNDSRETTASSGDPKAPRSAP